MHGFNYDIHTHMTWCVCYAHMHRNNYTIDIKLKPFSLKLLLWLWLEVYKRAFFVMVFFSCYTNHSICIQFEKFCMKIYRQQDSITNTFSQHKSKLITDISFFVFIFSTTNILLLFDEDLIFNQKKDLFSIHCLWSETKNADILKIQSTENKLMNICLKQ